MITASVRKKKNAGKAPSKTVDATQSATRAAAATAPNATYGVPYLGWSLLSAEGATRALPAANRTRLCELNPAWVTAKRLFRIATRTMKPKKLPSWVLAMNRQGSLELKNCGSGLGQSATAAY